MKKLIFLIAIIVSVGLHAQEKVTKKFAPPAGKALVGDTYGAGVSSRAEKNAISPKKLYQQLLKNAKLENVAVKGKVIDVCDKKGCWLTVQTDNDEKFFVKMKDYDFFVPTALRGKNIILEGNAENKVTSVNELKHYAEDAKKTQAEIDAITQPKEEIRFIASGIKVVN